MSTGITWLWLEAQPLHETNQSINIVTTITWFWMGAPQFINDDPECAGPGQYESPGSVGKQADSKKVTFPAVGFPLCSREKLKKVT